LSRHFPGATFALDVLTEEFSQSARRRFAAHNAPIQWFLADETAVAHLGLTVRQTAVAAHQAPERWQGLGFDPQQLQTTQVNILIEAMIDQIEER